ncbi:hypothetical protein F5Y07DRAFT_136141 [Xylaria sp. FL0933]|nr:hypothetical protein F5Y07DRAFT_136141 [Xylaria sp. FL0933]
MLTKYVLAGLIPGVVAKPIMMSSSSSAKGAFSTGTPSKAGHGHAHLHHGAMAEESKRASDGTYPVVALPNPSVSIASIPVVSASVSSALPSISLVSLVPSAVSSLAVDDTPLQPALSVVPSYAVALPPLSEAVPTLAQYAVKTPVVQPSLPAISVVSVPTSAVDLPYSINTPAVQPVLPSSAPISLSAPVDLPYSVKTPALQPVIPSVTAAVLPSSAAAVYSVKAPAVQPVVSSLSVAALPSAAGVYSINTPAVQVPVASYAVADIQPAASSVSSLVQLPESIVTPAVAPEIPAATYAAAPYGIKSAVPDAYGLDPAVSAVSVVSAASAVSAVSVVAVPTPASSYSEAADSYPDHAVASQTDLCAQECKIKCEGGERVADIGICRADCLYQCKNAEHPLPNGDVLAKEKTGAKNPVIPNIPAHGVTAPAIGAGSLTFEACMESCEGRYQHADIAGDVSTGRGSCTQACAGYAKSGAELYAKRNIKDIVPSVPHIGAGESSFQACVKSCKHRYQHADLASDFSTGKGSCEEACAAGSSYGADLHAKRRIKDLIPPQPKIGAGALDYEECMQACGAKFGHANLASDIYQGRAGCEASCAAGEGYGASISYKRDSQDAKPATVKRVVEETKRNIKDIVPPTPKIGAGSMSYEACLKDCHWNQQTAHIAMDVSQGRWSCKQACARYAGEGAVLSGV